MMDEGRFDDYVQAYAELMRGQLDEGVMSDVIGAVMLALARLAEEPQPVWREFN